MPLPPADSASAPATPPQRRRSTRAFPKVLLGVAALLLLLRVVTGIKEEIDPPKTSDLVQWSDAGSAEERARQANKPILYDFTASWCAPCKQMKTEVFASPKSAEFINANFVPVQVPDESSDQRLDALRTRYRVSSLPTLVVVALDPPSEERHEGYGGRAATVAFLERARATIAGKRQPTR